MPANVLAERIRNNSVKVDLEKQVVYAVGDRVRVRLDSKSKLEKAKQYFSSIIYTVTKVIKESPNRLRQYKLKDMKGYYNYSDLLSANTSQHPPRTKKLKLCATQSLGIRGQREVDQLLKNANLRQPPNDIGEYTVERIIAQKTVKGKNMYLVKWSGYPIEEATWEPAPSLQNAKELLGEFQESKK